MINDKNKGKVLVTGGAGFIGSHTVDALIEEGYKVVVVDDLSSGFKKNLNHKIKFYKASIENAVLLDKIFKAERPNYVVHLAAQKDVRASVKDPVYDARINILGSLSILQSAVLYGVKKVVFSSSGGAVYGEAKKIPTPETFAPQPISPYGITKLSLEYYLYYFAKQFGLKYAVMRYANVYGPRQDPFGEAGVVAIFCSRILHGEKSVINGSGRQTRDYVYVKDVVAANIAALENKKIGIWNVGTGRETDVNALYRLIATAAGNKQKVVHGPAKPGEQMRSAVDWGKIKKEINWKPKFVIERGVKETVAWFKREL